MIQIVNDKIEVIKQSIDDLDEQILLNEFVVYKRIPNQSQDQNYNSWCLLRNLGDNKAKNSSTKYYGFIPITNYPTLGPTFVTKNPIDSVYKALRSNKEILMFKDIIEFCEYYQNQKV